MPAMTTPTTFRYIGKPRRVREDRRFVAGKGTYVADVKLDGYEPHPAIKFEIAV